MILIVNFILKLNKIELIILVKVAIRRKEEKEQEISIKLCNIEYNNNKINIFNVLFFIYYFLIFSYQLISFFI